MGKASFVEHLLDLTIGAGKAVNKPAQQLYKKATDKAAKESLERQKKVIDFSDPKNRKKLKGIQDNQLKIQDRRIRKEQLGKVRTEATNKVMSGNLTWSELYAMPEYQELKQILKQERKETYINLLQSLDPATVLSLIRTNKRSIGTTIGAALVAKGIIDEARNRKDPIEPIPVAPRGQITPVEIDRAKSGIPLPQQQVGTTGRVIVPTTNGQQVLDQARKSIRDRLYQKETSSTPQVPTQQPTVTATQQMQPVQPSQPAAASVSSLLDQQRQLIRAKIDQRNQPYIDARSKLTDTSTKAERDAVRDMGLEIHRQANPNLYQ